MRPFVASRDRNLTQASISTKVIVRFGLRMAAVAAFAGVLAHFTPMADGAHEFVIEQGYEMGRPSLISLSMAVNGGKLTAGAIAGEAVVVSEGGITMPICCMRLLK